MLRMRSRLPLYVRSSTSTSTAFCFAYGGTGGERGVFFFFCLDRISYIAGKGLYMCSVVDQRAPFSHPGALFPPSTFGRAGVRYHRHVEALRSLDVSKLMVIWPNNIDSTRTIKKGRRIPKASACECPHDAHHLPAPAKARLYLQPPSPCYFAS